MIYPVETFTDDERERLAPHFTNLDRPVFALVNLPETVKGALFARYSRYPGTLRRLFLDEFADSLPGTPAAWEGDEGERAAKLYETIFLGYGDDSVAQLGGAHVACEWTSNVLTKILQRPRLARLPRAVDALHRLRRADARAAFGYRYYRDAALGPGVRGGDGRRSSTTYSRRCPRRHGMGRGAVPGGRRASRAAAHRRARAREGARPRSAACSPQPRSRTSGSSRPARPTSSSSSTCSPTRCPRRATYGG